MKPVAPPIGVAEDARGIVVSLPPRFWLLVSLRKLFRRMLPEPMAWTYRLPRTVGVAKRVEVWIAEVELQVRAEERRRAWTASDAEWHDTPQPAVAAPIAADRRRARDRHSSDGGDWPVRPRPAAQAQRGRDHGGDD